MTRHRWLICILSLLLYACETKISEPEHKDSDIYCKIITPSVPIFCQDSIIKVKAEVSAVRKITKVRFYLNDILVQELKTPPFSCDIKLTNLSLGKYLLKVEAQDSLWNVGADTKPIFYSNLHNQLRNKYGSYNLIKLGNCKNIEKNIKFSLVNAENISIPINTVYYKQNCYLVIPPDIPAIDYKIKISNIWSHERSFLINKPFQVLDTKVKKPGIALSFDDLHVPNWHQMHEDLLKPNNIRATFCLTHLKYINPGDFVKIKELAAFGHELGCHTVSHKNAVTFLKEGGSISSYIEEQVSPMLEKFKEEGLSLKSFIYPYGADDEELTDSLLNIFDIVRDFTKGNGKPIYNFTPSYVKGVGNNVVMSLGMDMVYKRTEAEVKKALKKAKEENMIILLTGHDVAKEIADCDDWTIPYARLKWIIEYAKKYDLKFYTLSELALKNK